MHFVPVAPAVRPVTPKSAEPPSSSVTTTEPAVAALALFFVVPVKEARVERQAKRAQHAMSAVNTRIEGVLTTASHSGSRSQIPLPGQGRSPCRVELRDVRPLPCSARRLERKRHAFHSKARTVEAARDDPRRGLGRERRRVRDL